VRAGLAVLAVAFAGSATLAPAAGPPPSGPALVEVVAVPRAGSADVATGFEPSPGRVVTVAHLLPGRDARVFVRDSVGRHRPAEIVAIDRHDDLALLTVRPGDGSPLPGSQHARLLVRRGDRPAALSVQVRRRIDAHIRPFPGADPVRRPALELEAHVRSGDSGAPLVDADGRVMGVLFASSRSSNDTAYAVAGERVAALLAR
jgi:S1-C subfamily serine protease